MELCWVPAGSFWMGGEDRGESFDQRELPRHECEVPYGFWMGRYPATLVQYGEFVVESGCQMENPASLLEESNEPLAEVSWYEAVEFCDWLTRRWRSSGLVEERWEVRLPSEAEWEKASRGGLVIPTHPLVRTADALGQEIPLKANLQPIRYYPWGEEIDASRANYRDTGIAHRNAVGCFPSGASPYGCEEMSGNVWEWTRTLWGEDFNEASFRYPYLSDDGREKQDAPAAALRIARGGAFDDDSTRLRCSFRVRFPPDKRLSGLGFRVSLRKML